MNSPWIAMIVTCWDHWVQRVWAEVHAHPDGHHVLVLWVPYCHYPIATCLFIWCLAKYVAVCFFSAPYFFKTQCTSTTLHLFFFQQPHRMLLSKNLVLFVVACFAPAACYCCICFPLCSYDVTFGTRADLFLMQTTLYACVVVPRLH